jgi:hypothetical protein
VDSKKNLQYTLRVQCEMLIMHVTRELVEKLLTFITKVTAHRATAAKGGPLRSQVNDCYYVQIVFCYGSSGGGGGNSSNNNECCFDYWFIN